MNRVDYELQRMSRLLFKISEFDSLSDFSLDNLRLLVEVLNLIDDKWEVDEKELEKIFAKGKKLVEEESKKRYSDCLKEVIAA